MNAKEFAVLVALGAIWGASFMFIKVGGAEMSPFFLVEMRLALAAAVLMIVVSTQKGMWSTMRRNWRPLVVMGIINCAVPYTLITWGENYISSGLAAIFNACAPLWAAALGLFFAWAEKLPPARLFGVFLGMAGVILTVSGDIQGGKDPVLQLIGQGMVLLAALSYALAGIYGRRALKGLPTLAPAAGQLLSGALILLPLAAFQIPPKTPSLLALGAVATLAVLGTAVASLIYYWLLARVGAARTLLVTYLLPGFALIWGAIFLSEPITLTAVLGLALVLLGITVTSGRGDPFLSWVRRRTGRAEA